MKTLSDERIEQIAEEHGFAGCIHDNDCQAIKKALREERELIADFIATEGLKRREHNPLLSAIICDLAGDIGRTMMTDLKPCPVYNHDSADTLYDTDEGLFCVYCTRCGWRTDGYGDEDDAIKAWNTRASQWISVEDRLPVLDVPAAVYNDKHDGLKGTAFGFAVFTLSCGDAYQGTPNEGEPVWKLWTPFSVDQCSIVIMPEYVTHWCHLAPPEKDNG